MGIDYSFYLAIGFIVDKQELLRPFATEVKEQFHMEDRFDPKTGVKLEPVKVIDSDGGTQYSLDGQIFDENSEYEVLEGLEDLLGCSITLGGGYSDNKTAYVSVNFETTGEDDVDEGRVSVGPSVTFEEVAKAQVRALDLKKRLNELGVKSLGKPKVYIRPFIG